MTRTTRLLPMLFLAALAAVPAACSKHADVARLTLRPCVVETVTARCGSLVVRENPAQPSGRHIRLRVVMIPARRQPAASDAFTYIAGGPGGAAASEMVSTVAALWDGVHERHDIVLVDQRGTGGSHPLECPAATKSLDTPAERMAYVDRCLATLAGDPTQYGTGNAMDDLDAVRAALGYETFDVYGTSYGATAAQVYLARHPRSVRTMILDGATLLDVPFFGRFAVNGERALDQVAQRCASEHACASAFPAWRTKLTSLIVRWNAKPASIDGTKLTGDGLAGVIHTMTLAADSAASIPLVVSRAAAGDYAPLARQIGGGETNRSIMFWSIFCNEPWVGLDATGPWGTYLDGYTKLSLSLYKTVCALLPARPERAADWQPPHSSVPVLALVGGADPQDPLGNLAGIHRALPNSRVIVVPGFGHAIGQYGCLPALVVQFVARGTADGLDTRCIRRTPPPPFVLQE